MLSRLLGSHRGAQGRNCRREGGHDAVTGVLHFGPTVGGDDLPQAGEVLAPKLVEGGIPEADHEFGGADEVGEEHRQHPAGAPLAHLATCRP